MPDAATPSPTAARHRPRVVLVVAALALLGPLLPSAAAQAASAPSAGRVDAPFLAEIVAPPGTGADDLPPSAAASTSAPTGWGASVVPPNTDFVLAVDGTVDAASRDVLEAAAGIWSAVLDVRVPIVVDVSMAPMPSGVLGAAGPTAAHFGRASFPRPDVLYPVALANQLEGRDLDPGSPDIEMELATTIAWDKTVGQTPAGAQSLLSVAVHELGHGLGHTSWVRQTSAGWAVEFTVGSSTVALAYDRLVADASGTALPSLDASLLGTALTSPLRWQGAAGRTGNGGVAPRLYAPAVFEAGSSVGHLDESTFGAAVMTPFLGRGETHLSIPAVTRGMLADVGWTITTPSTTTTTGAPTTTTTTTTAPTTTTTSGGTTTFPATSQGRAEALVEAVVRDFLGRPATAGERSTWSAHLLAGGSRAALAAAFANSDEWIGVIVDGLYRSTLGRGPDPAGRAHWTEVIRSGTTPAAVAAMFYASDEYWVRAGGTAQAWVTDLYAEVLGRTPDAGGLAFWVSRTAAVGRAPVAYDFFQSVESRRDRVAALFRHLLGRSPDAGGWTYWAGVLADGRDVSLAVFLASSDEYADRAARRFTR